MFNKARNSEKAEDRISTVTSKATGMQFRVNPSAFFNYHADLKDFLPKDDNFVET